MSAPIRQAVVLVGGLGTRLGSLTHATPKPLLHVAGRPFLETLILWLARAGVEDVILSTGYLAGAFELFLADGHASGRWVGPEGKPVVVRESRESKPLGTGGALAILRGKLDQRFFLINGDSFFACDLIAVASKAEALPLGHAVITTRAVPDARRFGRVETAAAGRVSGFREKGSAGPGVINAGVTVLSGDIVDRISALPCSIETEIYPALAEEGLLHAVEQEGYFIDIGLPETYSEAQITLPRATRRPAIFFDRDGVLNRDVAGYTYRIEDLVLMPGAARAVAWARTLGFCTVVVTNQAGIAYGLYTEDDMRAFHRAMNVAMRTSGGWIDAFYHCPYHPNAVIPALRAADHPDRKPNPGMIFRAVRDLDIDLAGSLLIGDKPSDVAAAAAAGLAGHIYEGGSLEIRLRSLLSESKFVKP